MQDDVAKRCTLAVITAAGSELFLAEPAKRVEKSAYLQKQETL